MTHQTGRRTAQMTAALVVAVAPALAPIVANATAFQLRGGSATAIGAALAGRTANDADVSLSIQNPAALRGVQGFEISGGLTGIFPSSDVTATRTTVAPPPGLVTGSDDPNETAFVPSLALGYRYNDRLVFGLAVKSPFGLSTEYGDSFPTAVDGTKSELTTISVTPQVSYDVSPRFTVAGGVTIQYADAELANFLPDDLGGPAPFDVTGDGIDVGYTVGVIFEPLEGTTVGLNYQSGFQHELEGGFSAFYPPFPEEAGFNSGDSGEAAFDLPDILSVGVIQRVTDDFRLMGEFEWTGWSDFDAITITNSSTPGNGPNRDLQGFDDSFMISFGGEYDWNDRLTLRAGAAYDQTPTTDAFRSQRTPDSDRYWLAGGLSYDITERFGVDAAYLLILADDTTIQDQESLFTRADDPNYRIDLEDGIVHYLSVNLRYRF